MVNQASKVKYHVLQSELEALLIEAELIRTHQPQYNILLKDDKSPLYVCMTKESFPRVLVLRKQDLKKETGWIFGPFPSGFKLRQVMKMVRKIFPWCNEARPAKKPCFYSHIGLCPGVCSGTVSSKTYGESMRLLRQFLRGKTSVLLRELKETMRLAAQTRQFELAATARDRIRMIQDVVSASEADHEISGIPRIATEEGHEKMVRFRRLLAKEFGLPREFLPSRIECYDVSNTQGTKPVVAMVVFEHGQPAKHHYRSFNIRLGETPNDFAMLQEALVRRQGHPEWGIPNLIIIDGGKGQLRAALKVWKWANPVLSLAKEPDRLMMIASNDTYKIVHLDETERQGQLAQQLRDEAHRFSKKLHTRRRTKAMIE